MGLEHQLETLGQVILATHLLSLLTRVLMSATVSIIRSEID